jgi:hypothetical protein
MGAHVSAESSRSSDDTTRRRLLMLMGAGGAAALASVVTAKEAQAGHDGTNVLHLAETNFDPDTGVGGEAAHGTQLQANTNEFALWVENNNGGSQAGGIAAVAGGAAGAAPSALKGVQFQDGIAVEGDAGSGAANGVGVRGNSGSGAGVSGHSETGPGGQFSSTSSTALQVTANVEEVEGGSSLHVENTHSFGTGIIADVQGGTGVVGRAVGSDGIGVRGSAGGGIGVLGLIPHNGDGVALLGTTTADDGTPTLFGAALEVVGRARFSTAGTAVIPAGQSSAFVANAAVTADSHISVTLVSDPGSRSLHWIERDAGNGFTVRLTSAPVNKRPGTTFTYLITEPSTPITEPV